MKVGFIGLGSMGLAVSKNILRAGFDLIVNDLRKELSESLIRIGAGWSETPAEMLDEVDVVATMVFGPKEIEEVVEGKNGLLETDCTDKGWIDLTTSSPSLMRDLARKFYKKGGFPIDAPVTGSVDSAIRGDMIMFVGGEDSVINKYQVVLEAMGEIRRVGRYGNGYVAKLVNNQLWKIHAAAIGEAMVTGVWEYKWRLRLRVRQAGRVGSARSSDDLPLATIILEDDVQVLHRLVFPVPTGSAPARYVLRTFYLLLPECSAPVVPFSLLGY